MSIEAIDNAMITVTPQEAEAKLQAYRHVLKKNLRATDFLLQRALRNLKKYRASRLVDMAQVMQAGGLGEDQRPRLAIARADWLEVHVERTWRLGQESVVFNKRILRGQRSINQDNGVRIPRNLFSGTLSIQSGYALVPVIPIEKLPVDSLENYWILWEAIWKNEPPHDPYLLKRIDNSLMFVVIDSWELTDLEKMIMRQVRR